MELSQKLQLALRKEPSNFIKQHMYEGNRTYMQHKLKEPESIPPILLPSVKCGQAQVFGPRNEEEGGFEQQQPPPAVLTPACPLPAQLLPGTSCQSCTGRIGGRSGLAVFCVVAAIVHVETRCQVC